MAKAQKKSGRESAQAENRPAGRQEGAALPARRHPGPRRGRRAEAGEEGHDRDLTRARSGARRRAGAPHAPEADMPPGAVVLPAGFRAHVLRRGRKSPTGGVTCRHQVLQTPPVPGPSARAGAAVRQLAATAGAVWPGLLERRFDRDRRGLRLQPLRRAGAGVRAAAGDGVQLPGESPRDPPGIEFTAKHVLRLGVALLGARIGVEQMLALGWLPVVLIAAMVPATILLGRLVARRLGESEQMGLLTGGAVAICGASAAMAISSILPPSERRERDTLFTVVGVTTLSTVCMVIYPAILSLFDLSDVQAGYIIGASVHDVAQVVGAGYVISDPAGDAATLTKLMRVAMLIPTTPAAGPPRTAGAPPRRTPRAGRRGRGSPGAGPGGRGPATRTAAEPGGRAGGRTPAPCAACARPCGSRAS
ncbi:MAG: putative sulfate exporter family transporter [Xanthomonadales bacterium]|nr:putative sulfate exporter family transporter [Xanthomonadales bacterium]